MVHNLIQKASTFLPHWMQRVERGKTIWSKTKQKRIKKKWLQLPKDPPLWNYFFNLCFAFRFVFRHFLLQPSFGSGGAERGRKNGKDLMCAIIYKIWKQWNQIKGLYKI